MRGVVVTPLSGSLHSHHPLGVSFLIYTTKPVALGPKPAFVITKGLSGELSSNRATYEHSGERHPIRTAHPSCTSGFRNAAHGRPTDSSDHEPKILPTTKAVPLMATPTATSKVLLGHLSSVVLPRIQLDELNHLALLLHHLLAFRKRNP